MAELLFRFDLEILILSIVERSESDCSSSKRGPKRDSELRPHQI